MANNLRYLPESTDKKPIRQVNVWNIMQGGTKVGCIECDTLEGIDKENKALTPIFDHSRSIWKASLVRGFDPIEHPDNDTHSADIKGPYVFSNGEDLVLTQHRFFTMVEARLWASRLFEKDLME